MLPENDLEKIGAVYAAKLEEAERLKFVRERTAQITAGKCSVRPLPQVATRPFRSELSVEQNSIFVSNRYKGEYFERIWKAKHPQSGEPVTRRLLVGKVHPEGRSRGVLTQYHQDVFYKLLHLWGQYGYKIIGDTDGKVYGTFSVSAYDLVMHVRHNNSTREYIKVQEVLRDLVSIPIVLENDYTWQGLLDREEFSLLGDVCWQERDVDKETGRPKPGGTSEVTVLFSSRITEGFMHKHIKMLLGTPYWSLGASGLGHRAEIARLLYPYLDAQLSTKQEFNICLVDLLDRFGLAQYSYKSKRREKVVPAINLLDGKPILGERYFLRVSLRESSDGEDYVLVARRDVGGQLPLWKDE